MANKTMPCAENNELIDTFTKRGSKCSGDALTLLGSADVYGGVGIFPILAITTLAVQLDSLLGALACPA